MRYLICKKPSFFFLLLCCCFALSSCHEDRIVLKGCCGNDAIDESFGNTRVYIPNIFTPNGDGLNDYFLVQGDSIRRIVTLEVRNRKDKLVYQVQNVAPGDYTTAWDGEISGNMQKGLYNVTAVVEALDGTIKTFETKVCNYPCNFTEEEEKISIDGCHFPDDWECQFIQGGCKYFDYMGCFK